MFLIMALSSLMILLAKVLVGFVSLLFVGPHILQVELTILVIPLAFIDESLLTTIFIVLMFEAPTFVVFVHCFSSSFRSLWHFLVDAADREEACIQPSPRYGILTANGLPQSFEHDSMFLHANGR